MSQLREREDTATKDEILEWLKTRISELEHELKILKGIVNMIEDKGRISITEKVEEIKVGKKRIARLYRGENYIRLVPDFKMPLPSEVREYLESVEQEIESSQLKQMQLKDDEKVKLIIDEKPDESILDIKYINLYNTIELLKAKAALKYAAELSYQIFKLSDKIDDI